MQVRESRSQNTEESAGATHGDSTLEEAKLSVGTSAGSLSERSVEKKIETINILVPCIGAEVIESNTENNRIAQSTVDQR